MWTSPSQSAIWINKFLESMTWINVPRTTFDLLLSPQTTSNSAQSFVLSKREVAVFYRAAHAWFRWPGSDDENFAIAICNMNQYIFGINVPRTTFDLLLSPQTTLHSAQSFLLNKGEITVFYRAAHAWFLWPGSDDVNFAITICNMNQ